MTPSLVILCLAIVALVAFAVSAALGAGLWSFRRQIWSLDPAARARIYFFAALSPFFIAAIVLVAALAPSFGWIADHCVAAGAPDHHSHPHVCAEHHVATWPAIPLLALVCFMALRVVVTLARRFVALAASRITRRELMRSSIPGQIPGTRVLPIPGQAHAFVLGLLRPSLFVTEGLMTGSERHHLPAVLAHEWAHIRRSDSLLRFIAGIGLAFHLPGIAGWLERALAQAQEMTADKEAAAVVGRANVARALVALARSHARAPRSAFAFSGRGIEARVRQLMDERARRDWPAVSTLVMGAILAVVVIGAGADAVHHGVETVLGVIGG